MTSDASADDMVRLGRKTDWTGEPPGIVRGVGRKLLLVGDDARTILELDVVRFTNKGTGEEETTAPDAPGMPEELG